MSQEPHTTDEHDFGDECPEVEPICAAALYEIGRWLMDTNSKHCNPTRRVAAFVVHLKLASVDEVCERYGLNRQTVYNHKQALAREFGLKYRHGKIL